MNIQETGSRGSIIATEIVLELAINKDQKFTVIPDI